MSIKAVIFDIDGTFYPNWKMKFHSLPIVFKHLSLFKAFSDARKSLRAMPDLVVEDFHKVQAEMTADLMKKPVEWVKESIDRDIYLQWTRSLKGVKCFHGVREVVCEVKDMGYKVAALSDFPILDKLKYFNLHDLFEDTAFCTEDSGYLKPHKKAFLYVCEHLGVKPEEVLYVGNSFPYDVIGSKNVGMKAAHVAWKSPKNEIKADFTFNDYNNFIPEFKKLLKDLEDGVF